jgi:hypothetical protein
MRLQPSNRYTPLALLRRRRTFQASKSKDKADAGASCERVLHPQPLSLTA